MKQLKSTRGLEWEQLTDRWLKMKARLYGNVACWSIKLAVSVTDDALTPSERLRHSMRAVARAQRAAHAANILLDRGFSPRGR